MKLVFAGIIVVSGLLVGGCSDQPMNEPPQDHPGNVEMDNGAAGSARVPGSINPNRNELNNNSGTSDQNAGSSATSGSTGVSGGR